MTSGSPTPTSQVPDRREVRSLFDWLAPNYDAAVLTYSLAQDLRWKSELLGRLRPRRGEKALDLACGTGLIYDRLAKRLGSESVVGLDLNRTMMLQGQAHGGPRQLIRGDSLRLPFRDASFDLVTAGYLFKYVPLERLSEEVRRVLRPQGRFGGYDFSAPIPSTLTGWGYDQYLRRVLPAISHRQPNGEAGWSCLFRFLADVATTSGWETRIQSCFQRAGFGSTVRAASLGGAITWFWAWRNETRRITEEPT